MSSAFRLSIGSYVAAIAVGAFAATAYLSVNSANPQSLADYISAICTKSFRSAPAAEAPYLAENVSAMTKMMIDMGTQLQEITAMRSSLGQSLPPSLPSPDQISNAPSNDSKSSNSPQLVGER